MQGIQIPLKWAGMLGLFITIFLCFCADQLLLSHCYLEKKCNMLWQMTSKTL